MILTFNSKFMYFFNFRAEYRKAMMNMSSNLVETVSIDYEDFNESFLTCGTCLCKYFHTWLFYTIIIFYRLKY